MIILDTNVLSELMRGDGADRRVLAWLRAAPERLTTTVITRAEVLSGLTVLPAGARRDALVRAAEEAFAGLAPVLPLADDCARVYADVVAERSAAGLPVAQMDALIAAIARVHGAGIATRNTSDFDGLGLRLIDPWTAGERA